MDPIFGASIKLATTVCELWEVESLKEYPSKLAQAQLDLQAEEAKGYDADDAKIENLQSQISIYCEAVANVLALTKGVPSVGSNPVADAGGVLSPPKL